MTTRPAAELCAVCAPGSAFGAVGFRALTDAVVCHPTLSTASFQCEWRQRSTLCVGGVATSPPPLALPTDTKVTDEGWARLSDGLRRSPTIALKALYGVDLGQLDDSLPIVVLKTNNHNGNEAVLTYYRERAAHPPPHPVGTRGSAPCGVAPQRRQACPCGGCRRQGGCVGAHAAAAAGVPDSRRRRGGGAVWEGGGGVPGQSPVPQRQRRTAGRTDGAAQEMGAFLKVSGARIEGSVLHRPQAHGARVQPRMMVTTGGSAARSEKEMGSMVVWVFADLLRSCCPQIAAQNRRRRPRDDDCDANKVTAVN